MNSQMRMDKKLIKLPLNEVITQLVTTRRASGNHKLSTSLLSCQLEDYRIKK